ncbi:MAG TPA: hypothetical protein VF883_02830 [Thermoanaerobaculia bacterium]|jgi:hypothetical protein
MAVRIFLRSCNSEFVPRTRGARRAPASDPKTHSFDVEIRVDNAANAFKRGMVASVEVGQSAAPLLTIPLDVVSDASRRCSGRDLGLGQERELLPGGSWPVACASSSAVPAPS